MFHRHASFFWNFSRRSKLDRPTSGTSIFIRKALRDVSVKKSALSMLIFSFKMVFCAFQLRFFFDICIGDKMLRDVLPEFLFKLFFSTMMLILQFPD